MRKEAIMALAGPLTEELGLEVLEVEFGGDAARRIVRIVLDAERGVTLADCEAVSRRLGDVLDAHEDVEGGAGMGRYMLEVSSPGVNRPLVKPTHFKRVVGDRVKLKLVRADAEGGRMLRGRLVAADDRRVTVEADDGRTCDVVYEDVERANLEYEFPEVRRPGKPRRSGKAERSDKPRR